MQLSIIIVNYNTKDFLRDCLKSVIEQTQELEYEILVSDNGSTDGSLQMLAEEFPQVQVITNGQNLGFGAANNKALDIATGKYIFYLNSDTILLNNAAKIFFDYFEEHDDGKLGAIGSLLLDSQKRIIHSGGGFPSLKSELLDLVKLNLGNIYLTLGTILHFKNMHRNHFAKEEYGTLDFITGADLFVKNNEYARFDQDFFLYYEDTFLQYKMAQAGLERQIIKGPEIIHLCGGSVGQGMTIYRKASFSRINYEFSRIKFLRKTNPEKALRTRMGIGLAKFLIILSWINPFIIRKTKPHIKTLKNL